MKRKQIINKIIISFLFGSTIIFNVPLEYAYASTNSSGDTSIKETQTSNYFNTIDMKNNKNEKIDVFTKNSYYDRYKLDNLLDGETFDTLYAKVPNSVSSISINNIGISNNYYAEFSLANKYYDLNNSIPLVTGTNSMDISIYDSQTKKLLKTYKLNIERETFEGKYLKGVDLKTSSGKKITLYTKSSYSSKYKLDKLDDEEEIPSTLYGKVSSSTSKISVDGLDLNDGCYSKITYSSDEYSIGDNIKISKDTNTIKIEIYEESTKTVKETYNIKIEKGSSSSDDDADDDDESTSIKIKDEDKNSLDFYKDSAYSDKLGTDLKEGKTYYAKTTTEKIKVDMDEDEENVRIFKGSSDYEIGNSISLSKGSNTLKIRVYDDEYDEDEDYSSSDYIEYKVVIEYVDKENATNTNSTTSSDKNTSNNITNSIDTTITNSIDTTNIQRGWNQKSDGSKFYAIDKDNIIKNSWIQDSNLSWYYLDTDGIMRTGWIQDKGVWYYLGEDGAMKTGWVKNNELWYYLDSNGAMKTGWIQNNGKWYYLNKSGSMESNTTIDGYKLNSSGEWIK